MSSRGLCVRRHLVALSILATAGIAGCGSNGTRAGSPDAHGSSVDAGGNAVDGGGAADGGATGVFACKGQPLPTTAPAMISVSGTVDSTSGSVKNAKVDFRTVSGDQSVGTATTMSDGSFAATLSTGGKPLDVYLKTTDPNSSTLLDTYLYPSVPLTTKVWDVPVAIDLDDSAALDAAYSAAGAGSRTAGTIVVNVVDCIGGPVTGATVSVSPSTMQTKIEYTDANGNPQSGATRTSSTGVAVVFNAPTGDVEVNASVPAVGMLRAHTVHSAADVLTDTLVQP